MSTVDRWYLYYRLSLVWLALLIAAFALVLLSSKAASVGGLFHLPLTSRPATMLMPDRSP